MKTSLSEMIKQLEEQGVDTSKFSINIDGKDLNEFLDLAKRNVEQGTVEHKTFRRWVLAQTWKMLTELVYDPNDRRFDAGWERYMRLKYDYKYQFTVLMDELKVLDKMKHRNSASEEYTIRKLFFTQDVVLKTCQHALASFRKNIAYFRGYFSDTANRILDEAERTYSLMISRKRNDYHSMYVLLDSFIKTGILNYINNRERKCQEWKDAYKAAGAYYSLQNMILYHDCMLPLCAKKESYFELNRITTRYSCIGELWRLHALMLETIDYNDFDLVKSICKRK